MYRISKTTPWLVFLFVLMLLKLPPLYLTPFKSNLLSTYTIAKLFLGLLFLHLSIRSTRVPLFNPAVISFLLYFVIHSISVITSLDMTLFLKSYQNLLTNTLLFLTTLLILHSIHKKHSLKAFFVKAGLFFTALESVYILFHAQILTLLNSVIQQEVLFYYHFNALRGRYHLDLGTELFIPMFVFETIRSMRTKNTQKGIIYMACILLLIGAAVFSNYRRRVIIALVSVTIAIILELKHSLKNRRIVWNPIIIGLPITILLTVVFSAIISLYVFNFNVFNRLLLEDKRADIKTIDFRVDSFFRSLDIANTSPVLGTGLGNYQLFLPQKKEVVLNNEYVKAHYEESANSPHSIVSQTLAESGYLGLLLLFIMITVFAKNDISILMMKKWFPAYPYVISFWGLFLYALFSPFDTVFKTGWFWFIRGILTGIAISSSKKESL